LFTVVDRHNNAQFAVLGSTTEVNARAGGSSSQCAAPKQGKEWYENT
jgi:hypothetical protein